MMEIGVLLSVLRSVGSVASLRKLLFEPSVTEQAGKALGAVSQETAARLFEEAALLPPREQEATLNQVTTLLEISSTADDPTKRNPIFRNPTKYVYDIQDHVERLIWLAVVYQILGHHEKSGHRVQRVRDCLAELSEAMERDVYAMIFFPQTRTGMDVPYRQAARRKRYRKDFETLTCVCEEVAVLV